MNVSQRQQHPLVRSPLKLPGHCVLDVNYGRQLRLEINALNPALTVDRERIEEKKKKKKLESGEKKCERRLEFRPGTPDERETALTDDATLTVFVVSDSVADVVAVVVVVVLFAVALVCLGDE
mgnify:CR=1 FL=1